MDPTIVQVIAAAFGQSVQSNNDQSARSAQLTANTHAAVMNGISAGAFQSIMNAGMPTQVGDLNTASHIPTPQPWVTPGYIYNPAANPAGAKQPGT